MMKKASILLLATTWLTFCHAANVLWDCVEISHYPNGLWGEGPGFHLKYYHNIDLFDSCHSMFWVDFDIAYFFFA